MTGKGNIVWEMGLAVHTQIWNNTIKRDVFGQIIEAIGPMVKLRRRKEIINNLESAAT